MQVCKNEGDIGGKHAASKQAHEGCTDNAPAAGSQAASVRHAEYLHLENDVRPAGIRQRRSRSAPRLIATLDRRATPVTHAAVAVGHQPILVTRL